MYVLAMWMLKVGVGVLQGAGGDRGREDAPSPPLPIGSLANK